MRISDWSSDVCSSDLGAAEQADLAALGERAHQVDDLDAGFQQLVGRGLFFVARGRAVDLPVLLGLDRADLVDRFAEHVHDPAQRGRTDRHRTARPVFSATRLRFRPSVEPSAMVRTTPSPSCCCTSSVTAVSCTFSASYTFGTLSRGNSTSTTAPMIWTILPWLLILCRSDCSIRCRFAPAYCLFRDWGCGIRDS